MSNATSVSRRRAIQTMGGVAGYLLLKPHISIAHQEIRGGLTIFAAAATETNNTITVLAHHRTEGFQLRRLVSHDESIVSNEVIDTYFPENFWPLDLGLYEGSMSSVVGSSTEEFIPTDGQYWSFNNYDEPEEPYAPPETDFSERYEIDRP